MKTESVIVERMGSGPFLSPVPGTFFQDGVTTADVLVYRDSVLLFCGGMANDHETIGVSTVRRSDFSGTSFGELPPAPVVENGRPGDFDSRHVADPASIVVGDSIYLYYSGLGDGADAIGLAISEDGKTFRKSSANPILTGRAPEIVQRGETFFLYFVLPNDGGGYTIFVARSEDGVDFSKHKPTPVLTPTPRAWDGYSVTTPRIFERDGRYAMIYAGSDLDMDTPKGFGIAYSDDLIHWSKDKSNPIFRSGPDGAWDDLAIWFGTVYAWQENLYLLYEGAAKPPRDASPLSQIGLAAVNPVDPSPAGEK